MGCQFYPLPPTLAPLLLSIFFCTNHVPKKSAIPIIVHHCKFPLSTCFVSEKEVPISPTNVRIAISKCILWLQWLVLRSEADTRAIHLTHSWLFVERLSLCAMPVVRNMKVSSSRANSVISGFIKTAPYCLLLSRSPLVLCLCFKYILFLPIVDLNNA